MNLCEKRNTAHSPNTVVLENLLEGRTQRQAGQRHAPSRRACEKTLLAARNKSAVLTEGACRKDLSEGPEWTFFIPAQCWKMLDWKLTYKGKTTLQGQCGNREICFPILWFGMSHPTDSLLYFRNSILWFLCSTEHSCRNLKPFNMLPQRRIIPCWTLINSHHSLFNC